MAARVKNPPFFVFNLIRRGDGIRLDGGFKFMLWLIMNEFLAVFGIGLPEFLFG
jgi:hypothetical protein